jgi:hypothetical protein
LRALARESLGDPRIANYFSRGHVKADDVLTIIEDDGAYAECRDTEAFRLYAEKREESDELNSQISAAMSAGSLNRRTTLIVMAAASAVLLIFFEIPDGLTASEKTDDEAGAVKIIVGLAAFACYGITVIEAFDNAYFNLHAARKSTRDIIGGSYTELAAARLELGISPESSQSIIRRFRAHSGLSPLPGGRTPQRSRRTEGKTTP